MRFHIKKSRRQSRKNHDSGGDSITSSLAGPSFPGRSCLKPATSSSASSNREDDGTRATGLKSNNNSTNVRFQEVHVREYERIVSDNPSCSNGAPIGCVFAYYER